MNNQEYDGDIPSFYTDPEQQPTARDTSEKAAGLPAGASDGTADEREARARDQRQALEDEAIEAEHLDYFMEHVSGDH